MLWENFEKLERGGKGVRKREDKDDVAKQTMNRVIDTKTKLLAQDQN